MPDRIVSNASVALTGCTVKSNILCSSHCISPRQIVAGGEGGGGGGGGGGAGGSDFDLSADFNFGVEVCGLDPSTEVAVLCRGGDGEIDKLSDNLTTGVLTSDEDCVRLN